jgi:lipoprotein NlpD
MYMQAVYVQKFCIFLLLYEVRTDMSYSKASHPSVRAWSHTAVIVGLALVLGACTSTRIGRAPVETRSLPRASAAPVGPDEYRVQPGDTLRGIGGLYNQDWRDLARWNQLSNPDVLEVGQVLRIVPPANAQASAAGAAGAKPKDNGVIVNPVQSGAAPQSASAVSDKQDSRNDADRVAFIWPAKGDVVTQYDEATNKGIGIAGKAGDPVVAAADGRVVYAGSGLRGYGNLVILKHNTTYLTAYAHNQALLVREDQVVKQGQRIADMGSSDADRVKLHFEVRRLGKPVDPSDYLPK